MFEPSFHFVLKEIKKKYGEEGERIAVNLRNNQILEAISNMNSNDFNAFRSIIYQNLEEITNLFHIVSINLEQMDFNNYHSFIPKKKIDFFDFYYQYYYTELENFLSNHLSHSGKKDILYDEIYEKLIIPFQKLYEEIPLIFSKPNFLISKTSEVYFREHQLLLLKEDLEKLIFTDDSIRFSTEKFYKVVNIFSTPFDFTSSDFNSVFLEIRKMINNIQTEKESRQQYISKVKDVMNDYEMVQHLVNNSFRIFMTDKKYQQLEKVYLSIHSLVKEGVENILDDNIQGALNNIKKMLTIPVNSIKKSKLYNFYIKNSMELPFTTLINKLIDYNSKLYFKDIDLLNDKIKKLMPLELVTFQEMENSLKIMNEDRIQELINLNYSRLQIYHLFSVFNFNSDKLIERIKNKDFDSLYSSISQRIKRNDYLNILNNIDSNFLDCYFDIHSMLKNIQPVCEEECMDFIFQFVKQKVKTSKS